MTTQVALDLDTKLYTILDFLRNSIKGITKEEGDKHMKKIAETFQI